MKRGITAVVLAITLTLGCGGVALSQASFDPKEKTETLIYRANYYNENKNYAAALEIYRFLVETQTNAIAQSNLGTMYDRGSGVAQDYKEALRLYGVAPFQWTHDCLIFWIRLLQSFPSYNTSESAASSGRSAGILALDW